MSHIYDHVIIIGIDGMGNFNRLTETPNTDKLFANGAVTYDALSLYPTISAQNWGAMLLGAEPEVHGLTNGIVGREHYTNKELPSVFSAVRKKYPDALLCSICNWNPINFGIIENDIGVQTETAPDDEQICEKIVECIAKKPKLLFIQLDDVDGAGHKNGYGTEGHLEQIRKTDEYIGRIYDASVKAGTAENTLFVAIADHGGNEHGHGGYSDGEKYIFFALCGKTVKKGEIPFAQTKDIDAIIRYALGIEIPEYDFNGYSSQIPENVFADYDAHYKVYTCETVKIASEPTPALDSENGLLSFFDRDDFKFAMFFDHDSKDELGKVRFTGHDNIKYYSGGRYGAMGELGITGYLTSDEVKFGRDSFTVGAWVKTDKALTDACFICGTKTMSESGAGFAVAYSCAGVLVGVETEDPSTYHEYTVPFRVGGDWIHILFAFDKKNMKIDIYNNFEFRKTIKLPGIFDCPFDALPFTVGEDSSFKCNHNNNFIFNIDDLLVFNSALDEAAVKKLAAYYKM